MLRLMRKWRGLYKILKTLMRALPHMSNLIFLITLMMFIFALLGMQFFGGIYNPSTGYSLVACPGGSCSDPNLAEKPDMNFDYLYPAMLTVFVLLTGEWMDAMETAADVLGPVASVFFIIVVLLGKYLLMNLLIAVILHEFADDSPLSRPTSPALSERSSAADGMSTRSASPVSTDATEETDRSAAEASTSAASSRGRRCTAAWAIRQPWFDQVVIVAILASSVCLALDSPRLDPESDLSHTLRRLDLFFTAFFFCEMAIKVSALGFARYIRNPWNQVDFSIVAISLLVLLADSVEELRPLRVLRVIRVLRPLRLISRNAGMKLIITTLFKAMPAVANVFGVVLALQVVFVILGMQLFSGTFASCSDASIQTKADCSGSLLVGDAN
eukprot:978787-Prymnesium_polylepis.1